MRNLIASIVAAFLIASPAIASAATITTGTSSSIGTSVLSGHVTSDSTSRDSYQTNAVSINGSAELVENVAINGNEGKASVNGAAGASLSGDASLSVSVYHEQGSDLSHTHFNGTQTSTNVTTGTSAFTTFGE